MAISEHLETMGLSVAEALVGGTRSAILALALALFVATSPLAAQESDDFDETEDAAADAGGEEEIDFSAIDELLAQDEEVLSDPGTYRYDPGLRRDPFRSLLRQKDLPEEERQRPEGIPGLLIDDLTIDGVFIQPEGPVAQVRAASEDTSFLLRPGDQLWDGDVVRIESDAIIFKQEVDDPTALKPFREVVKRINP
ncbi:MAG: hypothetical protein AAGN46_14060 [Acidobacteriota bacterium]